MPFLIIFGESLKFIKRTDILLLLVQAKTCVLFSQSNSITLFGSVIHWIASGTAERMRATVTLSLRGGTVKETDACRRDRCNVRHL